MCVYIIYVCVYVQTCFALGIEKRLSGRRGLQAHRRIRLPHAYVCDTYIHNIFYPSVLSTCIVSLTPMLVYACMNVCHLSMLFSVYVSAQGLGFRVYIPDARRQTLL